jgi:hypothetical protein
LGKAIEAAEEEMEAALRRTTGMGSNEHAEFLVLLLLTIRCLAIKSAFMSFHTAC